MSTTELFERYYGRIHTLLRNLSGSTVVADDLAQETCLRLLTARIPEVRDQERYVLRVACSCWARYLRKQKPTIALEDIPTPVFDRCPNEALERAEDVAVVRQWLDRLPPDERAVVVLVSCLGYSFVDASAVLTVARPTLVRRHRRALQWLKMKLRPMME
jgi:RNA polymerase sigma factor (sigma-70 family)